MIPILLPLALSLAILYWLLITTEGVFLGQRAVVWLYDLVAGRYDQIKSFVPADEQFLVAQPILETINPATSRLLDVACGTGRVARALLPNQLFHGQIVALDASAKMLAIAKEELADYPGRVEFIHHPVTPLPFENQQFEAITCLEALEFFPSDRLALQEMVRVLRPGGFLIITRRRGWEGRAFLHRYRSQTNQAKLLTKLGLKNIQFHLWEINYDLVTAQK